MIDDKVVAWVREAPFDNPERLRATPDFSYEEWFARGRALPDAAETLIEMLEREDLQRPSGDGMRVAYALGWIGDRRPRAIDALLRSLGSKDITLRIEATAALGRLGDPRVLPVLERLLRDEKEDVNVRGNACLSIGRLGIPESGPLLRETLRDGSDFLVACAKEALRLHAEARNPPAPGGR
jgi:hypothetical protein